MAAAQSPWGVEAGWGVSVSPWTRCGRVLSGSPRDLESEWDRKSLLGHLRSQGALALKSASCGTLALQPASVSRSVSAPQLIRIGRHCRSS